MEIKQVDTIEPYFASLSELLIDCVDSGASVGFLSPITGQEVEAYWQEVEQACRSKDKLVFLACDGETVAGVVQLALCSKENGKHRGELEKLMVSTKYRGQGLSKHLLSLLENRAVKLGLTLLVLDTRLGDVASKLYRACGYVEAGVIPQFAKSSNGQFDSTVYFYKQLQ